MAMSKQGAERAVTISALVVFGVYFYRHLTEGTSFASTPSNCPVPKSNSGSVTKVEQFLGFGTAANLGQFITAWGFTFFVISMMAQAAPGLGGAFAILVMTADLLGNGCQLFHDVNTKVTAQSAGSAATSGAQSVGAQASTQPHSNFYGQPPGVPITGGPQGGIAPFSGAAAAVGQGLP